jgi:hypothetical protein
VLRHLSLPVDADAACHELNAHLDELEIRVVAALTGVTKCVISVGGNISFINVTRVCRYYEAAKSVADSLRIMRDALSDLHNAATTSAG